MELSKAIEAAALAGIRKERAEISEESKSLEKYLPKIGEIKTGRHRLAMSRCNILVKRARILDAILETN